MRVAARTARSIGLALGSSLALGLKVGLAFGLALGLTLGSVAGADPKNDERVARELFKKGITAYNLGDYERAVGDLKRAYELSSEPRLLFNIAQALRAKRDHAQALVFYRNYLRLVPNAPNRSDAESLAVEMEQKSVEDEKRSTENRKIEDARKLEEARRSDELKRADTLRRAAEATALAERQRAAAATAVALVMSQPDTVPKKPVYKQWWLWTVVGVGVVGLGVGLGLGLGLHPTVVLPSGSLGTIDGRNQ